MRLLRCVVIAFASCSAWAQLDPGSHQPLGQLKEFLQLADSQVQSILANNDAYNRWSFEKQQRIYQVQAEIAAETGKEPLDPNALGIRYAEIEVICREMKERVIQHRTRNRDMLTPGQKTRLEVLEKAMKLAPVIGEAQFGNLVEGFYPFGLPFAGGSAQSMIGGIIGPSYGCVLPFSAPAIGISAGPAPPEGRAPGRWFDRSAFAASPPGTRK